MQNIRRDYLDKYLIKKHDLRQNNGSDCGIAVLAIIKRIRELSNQSLVDKLCYGKFRLENGLEEMDFAEEQKELREKYLQESNN